MASTNDLKNGMTLNLDGQLWSVVDFQHVKPGKGGAFVRTRLKSVLSGKVVDKTFNAGVKVDVATVDRRPMQYLYRESDDFVFMDNDTYDQLHVLAATVGGMADYLLEGQEATVLPTKALRCTSSCRRRSSSSSSTPSLACRATDRRAEPSRRGSRPVRRCRSRCSSQRGRRSRSTPATAATWASHVGERPEQGAQARARHSLRGRLRGRRRSTCSPPRGGAHREGQPPLNEHVAVLVEGVIANRERIDELLSTYAVGWTLERMPAVDRNLLRIGTYELLWLDDVPDAVAIDEAVELATSLSTDDSPSFVNGLLARLLELKPTLSR